MEVRFYSETAIKGLDQEQMKLTEVVVVFFLPFLDESFSLSI